VGQGSVVEVMEPKPPGLGELAKDLAVRHCSLLWGRGRRRSELMEHFAERLAADMLDAVFWRREELLGG
jgi:hypothetical protein